MKFTTFSKKQLIVLTWWNKKSVLKNRKGIICDGSVRSGKTLSMSMSFIFWGMYNFDGCQFGMSGKTTGSFNRNVIFWLLPVLRARGLMLDYKDNTLKISMQRENKIVTNFFYIFGGKDERSFTSIQGLTAAGWFFDEVALQPESFVNQAMSRCSVKGSKWWFNCNPDSPVHWFKKNFVDEAKRKNLIHLHFLMDDNPSLDPETKETYKMMFSGIFYMRYILGLWSLAEGVIYDMFDPEIHTYDVLSDNIKNNSVRYLAIDYGTTNPFVVLDIYDNWEVAYLENSIYYDSKKHSKQLTDEQYTVMIDELIQKSPQNYVECIIIDPSALSLKVLLRDKGYRVKDADNDVYEGIKCTASAIYQKKFLINKNNAETIEEIGSYIWDDKAKERGEEKPIKQNDHAMDAMRYFVNTVMRARILRRV